jgi:catechol 2,3-dioxygenase-like lactoylglutathione lyase family enzyme
MKTRTLRNRMITRIKFVSIPVRDQERSLKFYAEALGFEILTDQEYATGRRWIELTIPGGETNVVLFTAPGQESRISHFPNVVFWTNSRRSQRSTPSLGQRVADAGHYYASRRCESPTWPARWQGIAPRSPLWAIRFPRRSRTGLPFCATGH